MGTTHIQQTFLNHAADEAGIVRRQLLKCRINLIYVCTHGCMGVCNSLRPRAALSTA